MEECSVEGVSLLVDSLNTSLPDFCYSSSFCGSNVSNESLISCTLEISKPCFPEFLEENRFIFITNLIVIMIIGGLGNILNLSSVPYCLIRYKQELSQEFPSLCLNSVIMLMLHLSFCDLLYCLIGLPPVLMVYMEMGLPYSALACKILANVRNLIAYADFLSLAFIAFLRMKKMKEEFTNRSISPCIQTSGQYVFLCLSTWILSLLIISPITFELKWPIDWGGYGYNQLFGICNTANCPSNGVSPNGIVYTVGFFVPFFTINLCYITLSRIFNNVAQGTSGDVAERMQNSADDLRITLIMVCGSYIIFCGPLVSVQWIDSIVTDNEIKIIYHTIGFAWYWWIYAVNFLVYMFKFKAFRRMYCMFLKDLLKFVMYLFIKPEKEENQLTELVLLRRKLYNLSLKGLS